MKKLKLNPLWLFLSMFFADVLARILGFSLLFFLSIMAYSFALSALICWLKERRERTQKFIKEPESKEKAILI